jgi:hypothetical protein
MAEPVLHPDVEPFAFLLGTWRGTGSGEYPTIDSFGYGEEMRFQHVGDPFLLYEQRSWLLGDDPMPLHFERGFLRPGSGPGTVELTLAHPLGLTEIAEGSIRGTHIDVASTSVASTSTGAPVTRLERRIEVDGDRLRYELRMATAEVLLTLHLAADLHRA